MKIHVTKEIPNKAFLIIYYYQPGHSRVTYLPIRVNSLEYSFKFRFRLTFLDQRKIVTKRT